MSLYTSMTTGKLLIIAVVGWALCQLPSKQIIKYRGGDEQANECTCRLGDFRAIERRGSQDRQDGEGQSNYNFRGG